MDFLKILWDAAGPVYQQIIKHPWNNELAEGTLEKQRFQFYISQDTLYINSYAQALALLAARSEDPGLAYEFIGFAKEGLDIEREIHDHYMNHFNIKPASSPSLMTEAYANFLLTTINMRTMAEGIAALLPCFWIYGEVGAATYKRAKSPNPYQKWIDTYAGAEFDENTGRLKQITADYAGKVSADTRERMKYYFVRSSKYEWLFWDHAYHMNDGFPEEM